MSTNCNIETLVAFFTRNLHTDAPRNSSKNLSKTNDLLIRKTYQPQVSLTTKRRILPRVWAWGFELADPGMHPSLTILLWESYMTSGSQFSVLNGTKTLQVSITTDLTFKNNQVQRLTQSKTAINRTPSHRWRFDKQYTISLVGFNDAWFLTTQSSVRSIQTGDVVTLRQNGSFSRKGPMTPDLYFSDDK